MPEPYQRPGRSLVVWRAADGRGDTPGTILALVIERLRTENRLDGAREISLAITHCEEGLHWIEALERKRIANNGGAQYEREAETPHP
jgi:hypothetical protein